MNRKHLYTVSGIFTFLVVFLLAVTGALLFILVVGGGMTPVRATPLQATTVSFSGEEQLCRPEDTSMTINIVLTPTVSAIEYYYEYGTSSGTYPYSTTLTTATGGQPSNVVISGLTANTQYFYHMKYHLPGETDWVTRSQHSFHTQRAPGSTFTFTIISDSHLGQYGGNTANQYALYKLTLQNVAAAHPDFHIDTGDTFAMDPSPLGTGMTEAEAKAAYLVQRPYLKAISGDVPFYLAIGNHENEEGWNWDDTWPSVPADGSLAVRGIKQRKLYYPNPISDTFYSGNTDTSNTLIEGDHLQEDYYSWTWGDALFVVLDPYHYSMIWPAEGGTYGGEGTDETVSGDRWDWTLGHQQYEWLKTTLENSTATFKFVFLHELTGGTIPYGRGGVGAAPYFEWGGLNWDGTDGFATHRPGWEMPIHQLLVANHVDIVFHGHDHFFSKEELDGIVYLEVAKPDDNTNATDYRLDGGGYPTGDNIDECGFISVTVSPAQVCADYVRSYLPGTGTNGEVAYSFCVPAGGLPSYTLTAGNDGKGTVSLSPSGGIYYSGRKVTLTPLPTSGKIFVGWVGANASEIVNSGGVYTIVMNGNKSVAANFAGSCSTANLEATADTYMKGGGTTSTYNAYNYGGSATVEVNKGAGSTGGLASAFWFRGALLKWDLSGIGTGATVGAASITFYVMDSSAKVLNLYNLRRAWTEGSNDGATGSGASWTYYGAGAGNWGTAGAQNATNDRYSTNLWGAITTTFNAAGSTTVALNSSGVTAIQGWVTTPANNYGLSMQNYSNANNDDPLAFASRENGAHAGATLNVSYDCTGSNHAPGAELVWPASQSTGNPISPTLEITATDSDSNQVNVSFYGAVSGTMGSALSHDAASLAGSYVGTAYAVSTTEHAVVVWPDLFGNTWYQWYVVVSDGAITTTVPASGYWSFKTGADPTEAELASFAANPARGSIVLRWDTASELSNLGFHIWRATSVDGARERLTDSLIPSQAPGGADAGHYQFVDETAFPGLTYYYWVERVGVDGTTQVHGPISAKASLYFKPPPARD